MIKILAASLFCAVACVGSSSFADTTLTFEGKDGPGKGKHIVLISGDEEYRSEEGLPMLAKILSERHGFKCTVLFSLAADGTINPNAGESVEGIEALDSADLCLMLIRFRHWPDDKMKHFDAYLKAGKPFIGLRTATHAFNNKDGEFAQYAFNFPGKDGAWAGGFGKEVLGETWVSHWGKHKSEATRGIIEASAKDDVLMRGVADVFGTTDVYEAHPPADAKVLLRGQVLKGMNPTDEAADYKKPGKDGSEIAINDPMQAIAWSREYKNSAGTTNKVLATTMGAATDLTNEGLRRLLVNAAYSFTGLQVPASADVTIVGEYKPTFYSPNLFIKGVKPEALK